MNRWYNQYSVMLKNIWGKLKKLDYRLVILLAVFAVIGTAGILFARADSPSSVAEAEGGQVAGNASKLNIGGRGAVRFNGPPITYDEIGTSNYQTGATLTQDTISSQYTPKLHESTTIVNQHISNFGLSGVLKSLTIRPDNSYDIQLDDAKLDKRFGNNPDSLLRGYSDNVTLTACCNFTELMQVPPDANHDLNNTPIKWIPLSPYNPNNDNEYADSGRQLYYRIYADIVKRVVAKYPKIKYVQVWNEMKGYSENGFIPVPSKPAHTNGENYKKYTVLYNLVYQAVKSIPSRNVQVGGPYVVMRSYSVDRAWARSSVGSPTGPWGYVSQEHIEAVKYWHANKLGADFITLDIKNHNRCGDPNTADCDDEVSPDPYARMDKYAAVADWVRNNIKKSDGSNYPLWWAEWYARKNPIIQDSSVTDRRWRDPTNKGYQGTIPERGAIVTTGLIKVVKSNVRTALIWGVSGVNASGEYHPLALLNDSLVPTTVHVAQQCIKDHFSLGAKLYNPRNTNDNIEVLATDGPSGKWLLMANKTANDNVTTNAFGRDFTFGKHQVQCVQP